VLGALDAQTASPDTFEVVVVDDGSSDGTSDWLRTQGYSFSLRPLGQVNAGPAVARNAGVEAARGELVLFLDDDVVPMADLIAEHLRSHAAESAALAVIGPLVSLPRYKQPWVAWEQTHVERQYAAMIRGDFAPTFRQFWTGNASVAKSEVIAAGLFNPAFLRAEDVELGARLHERGVEFRFNPAARGLHHAERPLASWSNAHASYGRLEVQILGRFGEKALIKVLAENFNHLRPAMRRLVRQIVGRPMRHAGAKALLGTFLESPAAQVRSLSGPACSVLANLLYWQACREALGPERFAEVLVSAEDGVSG
jgi:glycosyltransferase involved in cell wall biosynthesis